MSRSRIGNDQISIWRGRRQRRSALASAQMPEVFNLIESQLRGNYRVYTNENEPRLVALRLRSPWDPESLRVDFILPRKGYGRTLEVMALDDRFHCVRSDSIALALPSDPPGGRRISLDEATTIFTHPQMVATWFLENIGMALIISP
jgi:hypothetical protein